MNINDLRKRINKPNRDQANSVKAVNILETMRDEMKEAFLLEGLDHENPEHRNEMQDKMRTTVERVLMEAIGGGSSVAVRKQMANVVLAASIHSSAAHVLEEEGKWAEDDLEQVGVMMVGLSMKLADKFSEEMDMLFAAALRDKNNPLHFMAKEMADATEETRHQIFDNNNGSLLEKIRTTITKQVHARGVELCLEAAHLALEASTSFQRILDEDAGKDAVRTMLETVALTLKHD
jgi:hypothetical protein